MNFSVREITGTEATAFWEVRPMIDFLHEKLLPTVFRAFGNYA